MIGVKKELQSSTLFSINYMNKVFKYAINIGLTSDNPTLNLLIPKHKLKQKRN